jgi:pilus assembly protein CpaB
VRARATTMIGIAIVFGGLAILLTDVWLKRQAVARPVPGTEMVAQVKPPEIVTIVVADEPLRFGTSLASARLKEIPWHLDALPHGTYRSIDELSGDGERVVISPIEPNEPVLLSKLSGPDGRATLSNLLSQGMRAVTIRIDEVAGVGGFVAPGDRVDVILTRDAGAVEEASDTVTGAAGATIASEVVVENVRVLSVGQGADERQTGAQLASSVTLEVTTEGANGRLRWRAVSERCRCRYAPSVTIARPARVLTTISAFGGSRVQDEADDKGSFLGSLSRQTEQPAFRTVIVTRGMVPESYTVVAPNE